MNARRDFLVRSGALVVSFSLLSRAWTQDAGKAAGAAPPPPLPGSLRQAPLLDSWIRIDAQGQVTVFTGKSELGQGVKTALAQIAAEELEVSFARVNLVTADTSLTANEGYTSGSNSLKDSGTAIRNAAAQVREILVARAAERLKTTPELLTKAFDQTLLLVLWSVDGSRGGFDPAEAT